MFPPRLLKMTS